MVEPSRGATLPPNPLTTPWPIGYSASPLLAEPSGITHAAAVTSAHRPIARAASIGSAVSTAMPESHAAQVPPLQVPAQPVSQLPQVCVVSRFDSQPSAMSSLQSSAPVTQVSVHSPPAHEPLASRAPQNELHWPQWASESSSEASQPLPASPSQSSKPVSQLSWH